MNEVVPIHGRGNFPTLEVVINIITIFNLLIYIEIMMKMVTTYHHLFQVKLCDLVSLVKTKLEQDGVIVREIRLNGSGASSVFHPQHHHHLILLGQIISIIAIFWSFSPRGLTNADWVLSQDQQSLQSLCRFTSLSRHLLFRISLCLFSFYARMVF